MAAENELAWWSSLVAQTSSRWFEHRPSCRRRQRPSGVGHPVECAVLEGALHHVAVAACAPLLARTHTRARQEGRTGGKDPACRPGGFPSEAGEGSCASPSSMARCLARRKRRGHSRSITAIVVAAHVFVFLDYPAFRCGHGVHNSRSSCSVAHEIVGSIAVSGDIISGYISGDIPV